MQDLIKNLFTAIEDAGLRASAYSTINMASSAIAIFMGILHGRKLKIGIMSVMIAIAAERILSAPLMNVLLFVENGFVSTGAQNAVVAFAYVPVIGYLVSKVLKRSWKEIWDVIMPVPLIMLAGARFACTVAGCCAGYPCSWGIYNVGKDDFLFPIQLLESLVTILILIYVFWREKKNNFVPDGRNVPIILISYGITRFFLEFLHDNKKIVAGLASTQFHCLLMIIVGIITMLIIKRSESKEIHPKD